MTEIRTCPTCNQTIRASNGLGTQSYNGTIRENHRIILYTLRNSKYELTKKQIYKLALKEHGIDSLTIHSVHSGVSDLLGVGKIRMIHHSKVPCYEIV